MYRKNLQGYSEPVSFHLMSPAYGKLETLIPMLLGFSDTMTLSLEESAYHLSTSWVYRTP